MFLGCHLSNLGLIWKMHWSGRVILNCSMAGHWHWNNAGVATSARGVSHPVSQRSFAGIRKEAFLESCPLPAASLQSYTMGWEESPEQDPGPAGMLIRMCWKGQVQGTSVSGLAGRMSRPVQRAHCECLLCFSAVIHGG